jgi:ABC-type transport system substrate-binding protein
MDYEHYRGVWAEVLHAKTEGVEIVDARAVRFQFKNPFLDFPILLGTAGQAWWVVPARYYEKVGQDGFMNAIGPRIAAEKWQDVFPTVAAAYPYPWEDIRLKE